MTSKEQLSARPLHAVLEGANALISDGLRVLIVAGRSRRLLTDAQEMELRDLCGECGVSFHGDTLKTLGSTATTLLVGNVARSVLVLQKARQFP